MKNEEERDMPACITWTVAACAALCIAATSV
jgi:hypothetical protein